MFARKELLMKKQSPIRLLIILLSISLLTALVGRSSHFGSENLGGNKDTESYIERTYPEERSHDDAPLGERSRDSFDLTEYENAYNEFSSCLYDRPFSSNQLFICESRARSYSSIYTTFPFCEIGYFNRNLGN